MLSRIAESFFWLGRYVERAEATTRLLAEHHQLLVQDRAIPESWGCAVLLDALGISTADAGEVTAADLVTRVIGTEFDASTIAGSIASARANARAIRESLSQDTFEALNATHLAVSRGLMSTASPGITLHRVLERLLVVNGVIDWTMPRDEAYWFLVLGRELERIDMVARLLSVRHDLLWRSSGPAAVLRASGALSPFLRTGRLMNADSARAFLVLDRAFPRSMLACAVDAEEAVRALQSLGLHESAAVLRVIGIMRSELEYAREPSAADIDSYVMRTRDAATQATDEANRSFFRQHGTIVWSH